MPGKHFHAADKIQETNICLCTRGKENKRKDGEWLCISLAHMSQFLESHDCYW